MDGVLRSRDAVENPSSSRNARCKSCSGSVHPDGVQTRRDPPIRPRRGRFRSRNRSRASWTDRTEALALMKQAKRKSELMYSWRWLTAESPALANL